MGQGYSRVRDLLVDQAHGYILFVYLLVTFHTFQNHVHFHYCTVKLANCN